MRLRTSLVSLVLATAIPIAVFGMVTAVLTVEYEHESFARVVKDRNRAFMSAVDTELSGHIKTLAAMTSLESLLAGDLRRFHRDAASILATQRDWENVVLSGPDGRQLVNVAVPFGEPLPPNSDAMSVREVAAAGTPKVVGLRRRQLTNTFGIPIRLPVASGGEVRYVLSALLRPETFAALLRAQNLPPTWVSGLVDAEGNFIARIPPRPVGSPASDAFRAAMASAREGWYKGATVEGTDTYTAFLSSEMTGWTIGLAVPSNEYWQSAIRSAWIMAAGALLCLTAAVAIAVRLGRRITTPIDRLANVVGDLDNAPRIDIPTDIAELRKLVKALDTASQAIGERRHLAQRERKVLEDADRAKDEFLAMLSHELRNPLAALTTAAQLLKLARPGSDSARSAQAVIERQTAHVTRLVEDLLDVSRITLGKASLELEPLDLTDLVVKLMETWRYSGRLGRRALRIEVPEALWIRGDRGRMEQVVANLVDNAVKFSAADSEILVSVTREDDRVALRVRDSGVGIPHDQLVSIFKLFVQAPQGLSRSRGGLGVGLAVVRQLVEMHHGTVEAHSDGAGRGSTFTVRLPLASPPSGTARPVADGTAGRAVNVLIVEDNADVLDTMKAFVRLLGHDVRTASTGRDGIRIAREWAPDVALVDIGLPDIDGFAVARAIRAGGRRITLVALTGYGQADDRDKALAAGFDHHIAKPASPDNLEALLAQASAR